MCAQALGSHHEARFRGICVGAVSPREGARVSRRVVAGEEDRLQSLRAFGGGFRALPLAVDEVGDARLLLHEVTR